MLGDSKLITALLFASLLVLTPFYSVSQQKTKDQLRREKKAKQKRIEEVENILQETASKKKYTLGELQAINQQIRDQQAVIGAVQSEISYLDDEISDTNDVIQSLENDLNKLKKEYGSMIYAAYKSGNGISTLTFLFSSSSFSELRSRMKYMEQYANARKKQAEQIKKVKLTLGAQLEVAEDKREEKNLLLSEELKESSNLATLKSKRSNVLKGLESEESQLRRDLETNKKALATLEKKITEIINAEIAAAKNARNNVNVIVSGSFEKNKKKFSWPVEGFISQKFGRQNHIALKGVVVENDGISIQTKQNEMARAIFDGDVRVVFFVPTMGYSALIKHGEYFTVYGGLKDPVIKAGDKVKAGQVIGEVITKPEGVTELWFEIRKGRNPLNPELWLAKR